MASHPGVRGLPANRIVLAFSPAPLLTGFPAAPCGGGPWSIQCYLLAAREAEDLAAVERPALYLLAYARCNAHGLPSEVRSRAKGEMCSMRGRSLKLGAMEHKSARWQRLAATPKGSPRMNTR